MKRFGILNILLIGLITLALWRTAGVWRRPVPERELPPADPSARLVPGEGLLAPPSRRPPMQQVVAAIAEHDLFDQTRREASTTTEAPAPIATPVPPPPTLKLAGVIVVGPVKEVLLIDSGQGNRKLRLREGEDLQGYKIGRIGSEQVALVGPGGEETLLQLEIEKGASRKNAFGPGGKPGAPTPVPAVAQQAGAQPTAPVARAGGSLAPAGDPSADARARAESARERLRRLRQEAARQ